MNADVSASELLT